LELNGFYWARKIILPYIREKKNLLLKPLLINIRTHPKENYKNIKLLM